MDSPIKKIDITGTEVIFTLKQADGLSTHFSMTREVVEDTVRQLQDFLNRLPSKT